MTLLSPPGILALLIAIAVHESAHAWAAYRLGDATAYYQGRVTLNPLAHLDPIGTLVFIVSLSAGVPFGWAKPVPVNLRAFKHPNRDQALVALAGPASNFLLALVAFLGLMVVGTSTTNLLSVFLLVSLSINLGLMAFNLLPIAPLDGSKILLPFVPARFEHVYDQWLQMGLYALLAVLLLDGLLNINFLGWWFRLVTTPFFWLVGVN